MIDSSSSVSTDDRWLRRIRAQGPGALRAFALVGVGIATSLSAATTAWAQCDPVERYRTGGSVMSLDFDGTAPRAIDAADLRRTGAADLVIGYTGVSGFVVMLQNGPWSYDDPVHVPGTGITEMIRTHDMNGDGAPDVVRAMGSIAVTPGDGTGGFETEKVAPNALEADAFAIGDWNGDGIPDVVSWAELQGQVELLTGKGDGTFLPGVLAFSAPGLKDAVLVDMDGDGFDDLVTVEVIPALVRIHLSDGTNGFTTSPTLIAAGSTPSRLLVGELNDDGTPDVVIANNGAVGAVVQASQGDGTYLPVENAPIGIPASDAALVDVSGDGLLDIVVANGDFSSYCSVCLGEGGGQFSPRFQFGAQNRPEHVVVADFDHDGLNDFGAMSGPSRTLSVVWGGEGRTLDGERRVSMGATAEEVRLIDLSGDGRLDLLTANDTPSEYFVVRLGDGDGAFPGLNVFEVENGVSDALAADVNQDGHADLVAVTRSSAPLLLVYHGLGNETWADPMITPLGTGHAEALFSGDFNEDGAPDLAVARVNAMTHELESWMNTGGGDFVEGELIAPALGTKAIQFADFTGDGTLDVVYRNELDFTLQIRAGLGDGTFAAPTVIPNPGRAGVVVSGDLTGNGVIDLVAFSYDVNALTTYRNDGTGVFAMIDVHAVDDAVRDLAIGDLTGDGVNDVLVMSDSRNRIHAGLGDGMIEPMIAVDVVNNLRRVALGDVNEDGALDILMSAGEAGGGSLRISRCATCVGDLDGSGVVGMPDLLRLFTAWGPAPSAVLADITHDGVVDFMDVLWLLDRWGECE